MTKSRGQRLATGGGLLAEIATAFARSVLLVHFHTHIKLEIGYTTDNEKCLKTRRKDNKCIGCYHGHSTKIMDLLNFCLFKGK